ncbi:MAG: hypothetical protein JWO76_2041, partial [Nocardioides sp.]|nr:hypothetical protein [Nocardioides sp.]
MTSSATYPISPGLDVVSYDAKRYLDSPALGAFAVSATGEQVAFASAFGVNWYDLTNGHTRKFKIYSVADMDMSADGRFVVVGHLNKKRHPDGWHFYYRTALLDTATNKLSVVSQDPREPEGHWISQSVSISDDARLVGYEIRPAGGQVYQDARVLDRRDGTTASFAALDGVSPGSAPLEAGAIDVSGDGSTAIVSTNAVIHGSACELASCVVLWDLATGAVRRIPSLAAGEYSDGLTLDQDGSVAASSAGKVVVVDLGDTEATDEVLWTSDWREEDYTGPGTYLAFDFDDLALSEDGSKVAYNSTRVPAGDHSVQVPTFHVRDLVTSQDHTLPVTTTELDAPDGSFFPPTGYGAAFADHGRYAFTVAPTVPGAGPTKRPTRT